MTQVQVSIQEHLATLTNKGQVTIPIDVRRLLGLTKQGKVAFVVDKDKVRLMPAGNVVSRTAGAVKSTEPALTATQLREVAEETFAAEARVRAKT